MENVMFYEYLGIGFIAVAIIIGFVISLIATLIFDSIRFGFFVGFFLFIIGSMLYTADFGRFDSGIDVTVKSSISVGVLPDSSNYYVKASKLYTDGDVTYTYLDISSGKTVEIPGGYDVIVREVEGIDSPELTIYEVSPQCEPQNNFERWFGSCFGLSSTYVFMIPRGTYHFAFSNFLSNDNVSLQ